MSSRLHLTCATALLAADGDVCVAGITDGSLPGSVSAGGEYAFLIKYGPGGPQ